MVGIVVLILPYFLASMEGKSVVNFFYRENVEIQGALPKTMPRFQLLP